MKRKLIWIMALFACAIVVNAQQPSRFVDNRDSTITDTQTKLMWMKYEYVNIEGHELPGGSYDKALKWVKTMNKRKHAGYADWRLPSAKELLTLCKVKETRRQYLKIFEQHEKYDEFWSSNRPGKYVATFVWTNGGCAVSQDPEPAEWAKQYAFPVAIPSVRLVRNVK